MEYIQLNNVGLEYPTGANMNSCINYVKEIKKVFPNKFNDSKYYINIWCRGSSGAILSALFYNIVVPKADCKICHIKKEGECSHTSHIRYHMLSHFTINIVLDDFVCSGLTIYKIVSSPEFIDGVSNSYYLIANYINDYAVRMYFAKKIINPSIIITDTDSIRLLKVNGN